MIDLLIDLLPLSILAKTFVFIVLGILVVKQDTSTRLGWWINAMFVTTALTSAVFFWLLYEISGTPHPVTLSLQGWGLLVLLNLLPVLVSISGVMVARHTIREGRHQALKEELRKLELES